MWPTACTCQRDYSLASQMHPVCFFFFCPPSITSIKPTDVWCCDLLRLTQILTSWVWDSCPLILHRDQAAVNAANSWVQICTPKKTEKVRSTPRNMTVTENWLGCVLFPSVNEAEPLLYPAFIHKFIEKKSTHLSSDITFPAIFFLPRS